MPVSPYLDQTACVSTCGQYRYMLERRLTSGPRTVVFVGLNPSTADAQQDDPTVRKCVGFARRWGFDRVQLGNLYAYRSTDPKRLRHVEDPYGPDNRDWLVRLTGDADLVICAWGQAPLLCYAQTFAGWLQTLERARHLGRNKDGSPKHPLYLPYAATPECF